MNRAQTVSLWAGNVLCGVTGALLLWVKTLYRAPAPEDPFEWAALVHPWQAMAQHLHIWTAPVLVLAIGMVWHAHAWAHWRGGVRRGRWSGLAILASALPMIVSGYAIGTSVSDRARSVWVVIHLAASFLWLVGFGVHALSRRDGSKAAGGK